MNVAALIEEKLIQLLNPESCLLLPSFVSFSLYDLSKGFAGNFILMQWPMLLSLN